MRNRKVKRRELLPGEVGAMFNSLIYMWSLVDFRYENLTIEQQRLMTPGRFKNLITHFKEIDLEPKSRIAQLLHNKEIPNFEDEPAVKQMKIELPVEDSVKSTAEDRLEKLASGLGALLESLKG